MNVFENQMFNPNYINEDYYRRIQIMKYNADQNERVVKALHAFEDMLKQVDGMDEKHQQLAFGMCLATIAKRCGWK